MAILNDEVREKTQSVLEDLTGQVRLVMFTQNSECEYCEETRQLVEEVGALSDQIAVEVHDFTENKEKAEELGIDKTPAIAVIGAEDYGVRFYGIPSGYEFTSFMDAIQRVAAGEHTLNEETISSLAQIKEPVHMQVFVTPTCPYCPQSVVLAHQLAIASPMVRADMVEATEFPELAMEYEVRGVPRTVINGSAHIEGAAPEQMLMEKLNEALAG